MLKSTHYGAYSNGLEIALIFLSEVAVRSGIEQKKMSVAQPRPHDIAKLDIYFETTKRKVEKVQGWLAEAKK